MKPTAQNGFKVSFTDSGHSVAQLKARLREGMAHHAAGRLTQASETYHQILQLHPKHFDTLFMLSMLTAQAGDSTQALALIDRAIDVNPVSAAAHSNRGIALNELQRYQAAVDSYNRAITIKPDFAVAFFNRGIAFNAMGQHQDAIGSYERAIAILPEYAQAYANLGDALQQLKQFQSAIDNYDRAIAILPDFEQAYANRGDALQKLKQHQAAVDSYQRAIAIKPDFAEAFFNCGNALNDIRQHQAAIESYNKAIAINPDYVEAYDHRGIAFNALKLAEQAIDSFNKAIAIKPDCAEAYANLGLTLCKLKRYQAALTNFDKAISINPDSEFLHGARLHMMQEICDWRAMQDQVAELIQKIQRNEKASQPFTVLALTSSLPVQRRAAEIGVNETCPGSSELGGIPKRPRNSKIRLGYFSMDFRNHPVSFLTAELFELHDRDRFEVYAFSFGPDTKDEMRQRLEIAFDMFIDVQSKSDKEVAELSRRMGIDIAIDLAGFTGDSRTGIFALRAAPIQVNYLGYPGTMGADYMDYLIADRQLIPEAARAHYAEKIAYLPDTYMANDSRRSISETSFSREALGLPQTGFVYCCFNNSYKITPNTFDGWMRILKRVDGSVLWLSESNAAASDNLRKEAARRGVEPQRLVFAPKLPLLADHLARHRAADLFIDTFPYNAHTTASDALWAGLPVLTCAGEAFASRVAASLLTAIDLPELITSTQEEYEALAIELAMNPQQLNTIRQELERNRLTSPLFDTVTFTRNIEVAYAQMMERYHANLPPDHIVIAP